MGSLYGAELCELTGLFMLNELSKTFIKENTGIYRDDGLSVFKNYSAHQLDKARKEMIELFKKHGLNLEIKCNLKTVDYLDVTFDLNTGIYKPYNKINNFPRYINAKSNHPPSVLKQIPTSVSKRISSNSCNEEVFNAVTPFYNNILTKYGYSEKIVYEKPNETSNRRNRQRNIIWYNPPFSKNVKTNVAKHFLYLLNKHFGGKDHKYYKIFNRNNVKISYSCMDNLKTIISSHNKKVSNSTVKPTRKCNCRNKNNCPLEAHCLTDKEHL